VKYLAHAAIGLATLALALSFVVARLWPAAAFVAAWGGMWIAGQHVGWGWTGGAGLTGFIVMAVLGIWSNVTPLGALAATVTALGAWDLQRFTARLGAVDRVEDEAGLTRAHLQRLLPVLLVGLLAGFVALEVRLALSFGWALVLGALAILGLSRAIGFIQRKGE
jgi:NADH:ubiquinone oxidoreductase subunit 3 (subunit A)